MKKLCDKDGLSLKPKLGQKFEFKLKFKIKVKSELLFDTKVNLSNGLV